MNGTQSEGRLLCLVSCVAKKSAEPAPAKALYLSPWFRLARAWVEAHELDWRILSAEHGLLSPDDVVAPYNATLNRMEVAARRRWAAALMLDLLALVDEGVTVILLAGARYREFILDALEARGCRTWIPMQGLGIGQQLSWLKRTTDTPVDHLGLGNTAVDGGTLAESEGLLRHVDAPNVAD